MKKFLQTFMFLMVTGFAFGQVTVTGKLVDADNGMSLISATITLEGTSIGTLSDYNGSFALTGVTAGQQTINISYVGYNTVTLDVNVKDGQTNDLGTIEVSSSSIGLSQIEVVASIATDRKTPVAVSTISAEEIELKLGNQEFPEILKSTPSIYTTKQGGGYGDARINVRGFSQENVALLINGISVSGMEDNKVYWSNWSGLGDVTRTMQVQRGLGASRMAISSVGGTINIVTKTTDQKKGGNVFSSIGNNGYRKMGLTLSTGRSDNGWAYTFSGSRTTGDGYIQGNYIDAWSYFGSVAKELNSNNQLLFTLFGAPQRHGQRSFWHPIDEQRDQYGTRWNDDFGYYKGQEFTFRENFYHKPQANLSWIWDMNEKSNLITSVYASSGRGGGTGDLGRREYRIQSDIYGNQNFDQISRWNAGLSNDIGLPDFENADYQLAGSSDTLSGRILANDDYTDGTIKRASMNEHQWYGALSTFNTQLTESLNFTVGVDLRFYTGSHYRKVIDLLGGDYWFDTDNINAKEDLIIVDSVAYFGNLVNATNDASDLWGRVPAEDRIDYYNDENINWYGFFTQLEYSTDRLSAFISGAANSTQMRRIDFFNKPEGEQVTDWLSYFGGNAKLGANFNITENHNVFLNSGFISRAPYFDALFPEYNNDEPNTAASNESVYALEAGYGLRTKRIAANFNAYYTDWRNKTEFISSRGDDGTLYFTSLRGVDALHMGVEVDLKARLFDNFQVTAFAGLADWQWKNNPSAIVTDENQNVIGNGTEITYYIDGLKVGGSAQTTIGAGFDWDLAKDISMNLQWYYFDNLYANFDPSDRDSEDLTGIQALQLPSYSLFDLGLAWKFKFAGKNARLNANVNNLFNVEYIAEAQDRYREGVDTDQLISDTRGWYGFGRTWNLGLKVNF